MDSLLLPVAAQTKGGVSLRQKRDFPAAGPGGILVPTRLRSALRSALISERNLPKNYQNPINELLQTPLPSMRARV